jgi:integrin alpha FG-GAP repeat containing protein 1
LFCLVSESLKLPSAKNTLPIVADITGDMKTDILGYNYATGELSVWKNEALSESNDTSNLFNVTSAANYLDKSLTDQCTWSNPHGNAFIDLDGDCLADLVFVCSKSGGSQYLQIWTNKRDQGFALAQTSDLPAGAGPISFADIDGDGAIDIVFPVCVNNVCTIHIVYNQQMGLCRTSQENLTTCRKAQNLCVADPNFKFDFTKPNTQNYTVFDIDPYLDSNEYILTTDTNFRGKLPVPIHTGDYNLDGYPDLLVTTTERVLLLQSVLCDSTLCSSSAQEVARRSFTVVSTGVEELTSISNPKQAAFFDIDEDVS